MITHQVRTRTAHLTLKHSLSKPTWRAFFRYRHSVTVPHSTDDNKETPPLEGELTCVGVGQDVSCMSSTEDKEEADSSHSILDTILLISPFFFWGTSMVAMKELSPHTTTLFLAAWRLIPAGIVLLLWAYASGRPNITSTMGWLAVALFGVIDGTCFQGFLAEGLQRTSAGLGSVIIDSQPLTVALLASVLFQEKLGVAGWLGMFVGVLGLTLLEVPHFASVDLFNSSNSVSSEPWSLWDSGEWWMLLAAQSMAIGTVMVRWVTKYSDPVVATGWHMILGGIPLALLSISQEGSEVASRLSQVTFSDIALLLYISLLGSAASYGVFYYEASVKQNLTALSSLTFLTPMFAALGGYLVLHETLTPLQLSGAVITLGAVALITSKK